MQPFVLVSWQQEMENKAMYLSTYEERENGSVYEEAYDGHNLSKLSLCDEGELVAHVQVLCSHLQKDPARETDGL